MSFNFFKQTLIVALLFEITSIAQQKNALDFDGINDYVDLNVLQDDFYAVSDQFTIEFWMKGHKDEQTSSIRTVMFAINEPVGENRLLIIMGGPTTQDGKLMIYPDGSWGTGAIYTSSIVIGDGNCHHIAYSYDNGNCKVYIDGVLVDSHFADCPITANDRYSLGQEYDNFATSQFYNGELDDIRIWGTVRTADEIAENMNEELSGSEPGLIAYYDCNQGTPLEANPGLDYLTDHTNNNDGDLYNFALDNASSNWVRGVCVSPFVNIEEPGKLDNNFTVFPNPTEEFIRIQIEDRLDDVVEISIVNVSGQLVFTQSYDVINSKEFICDVSHLENGFYIVEVKANDSIQCQSFVKK